MLSKPCLHLIWILSILKKHLRMAHVPQSLETLITLICEKIALECHFYGHWLDNFYNLLTVRLAEQLLNIWNPCAALLHSPAYYRDPSCYTDRLAASLLTFVLWTSTIIRAAKSTFHEPIDTVIIYQKGSYFLQFLLCHQFRWISISISC